MKYVKSAAFVALAGLVSACGGGSGGSNGMGGDTSADQFSSYNDIVARGETLFDQYENATVTDAASVPTAGSATYSGVVGYTFENEDEVAVASEIRLNANFDDSTVDGGLSNFRDSQNIREDIYIAVRNGSISGNAISGDLAGDFEEDGETVQLEGSLAGNFFGDEAEAIFGTLELEDQSTNETIGGEFGATR